MTTISKIGNVIIGLIMIVMGVFLVMMPEFVMTIVVMLTGLSFMASGIKSLFFFFTLGRSMVDGRMSLYRGLILLDLGLFTCTFAITNIYYTVLYIAGVTLFTGVVDLLRAREAYQSRSPSWRFPAVNGLTRTGLAIAVIISGFGFKSVIIAMIVYGAGLIYSGIVRIVSSLRKTAIVYIQ